ncbi:formylglycine-generating enzyme family protein [Aliiroseovarius sp. 2305UL8-7]|uniref:formylglycine-generating enzyme family protein n=1 Tax=Aliiroseovarius conchicola TaxID=3121637 RepID=UPI0035271347
MDKPTRVSPSVLEDIPHAGASKTLTNICLGDLVAIKGGFFDMGARRSRYEIDMDSPQRKVRISSFLLSRYAVTNAQFSAFVDETGYKTTAEREGWSFVFSQFLNAPELFPDYAAGTPWWRRVDGANWHAPEGPESGIENRLNHPVTHVSWHDATAYASYLGARLPTEAEWEFAARGGLRGAKHPWGNSLVPATGHAQNVWQGSFPDTNTQDDGYHGTAPVDAFEPNNYGLFNMTGNVWEWCSDWFGPLPEGSRGRPPKDPTGAASGVAKVMRGGSCLCHASYCERYFVHSRTSNTPDSSTGHIGFRLAV